MKINFSRIIITLLMASTLTVHSQDRFTAETLWELERISNIKISPDNNSLIFGVTKYDVSKNKGQTDIFLLELNKNNPIKLTNFEGNKFNASFRPDGKKIGFLTNKTGSTQLWEMSLDGKDITQITNIEGGISGFNYSPDMKHIVYIKNVKIEKDIHDIYPDLPLANALIYDDLMYRHWDAWHDYTYNHIFIAPYNNGKIGDGIDILKDEVWDSPMKPFGGMEQISWSPNGDLLAYTCKKLKGKKYATSTNSDIYLYNLTTKKTDNVSASNVGYDHDPVFSPDGKTIVWRSMATDGFEADKDRIMLCNIANKNGNQFVLNDLSANFDQSSNSFQWSKDGKKIYFISGYHATFQVYNIDVSTNKITQLTDGDHDIQSFFAIDEDLIVSKTRHDLPTEIFKINNKGEETQLTQINSKILNSKVLGKTTKRWVKTTDGKEMLVWVILPPNFNPEKKYPALLYCQGGPQSAVSHFFSYRWNFQMMAAHDYVIVAPNRRGLPTFGQEWNDQISGDYGGQNMKDYLSAIDDVAKEPWVDKNKLGAVGASYGGFSVYWLAGNHNKRFKTFIAHCGIFNFESMYLETEEMFFVNFDYKGAYWQKPKPKSYDFSPHNFVGNWDTPMLVIHGGNDFRIPYTQGMQAFNANQLLNIPSKFLFFPDETHFVSKPQNSILWQREFFNWLDKFLK